MSLLVLLAGHILICKNGIETRFIIRIIMEAMQITMIGISKDLMRIISEEIAQVTNCKLPVNMNIKTMEIKNT